ncbi:uncharacterized protein SCHCODRAFT_02629381 [Schizophyllum commune H4-8]|nr:uncharacterized protein SCHCODRAFT_02629381 [Schizophyllum commune H4-8]KAI5891544.1 hypothetical protein SCHCODRAFT_02629381 [Schizophyllum commune H4-8]
MQRLWPTVRDRGLQPLLESLQRRTPMPINLAVGRAAWNGLSELQYYSEPQRGLSEIFLHGGEEGGGYISATALQKSIQNLAQIAAQHGGSTSQHAHLVVVAASSAPQAAGGPSESTWTSLATEAARLRILPHLILGQGADAPGLLMFFTTVVRLQGAAEDAAGLHDGAFSVRTSTRAGAEGAGAGTQASGGPSLERPHAYPRHAVPDAPATERRAGPSSGYAPHHHHSLSPPQMGASLSAGRGAPARSRKTSMPEAPRPSIVSQLQHLHGLSKKRIYGAKPARRPFIRGEEQRGSGTAAESRRGPELREDEPLSAPASPTRARYAALPGAAPFAAESGSRESARGAPRREHYKDAQVPRPMYNPPAATRARANTVETASAYADRPEAELLTRDPTSYGADLGAGNSPVSPSGFKSGSTSSYAPISPTGYPSASSSSYAPMLSAPSYGATTASASYGAAMNPTAYGGASTNSGYRTISTSAGYGAVPPSAEYGASTSSAGYGPAPAPPEQQPLPSWSSFTSAAPSAGYGGATYGQPEFDAAYAAWTPSTYTSAPPSPTQGYTYLPFGVTDPYAAPVPMQPLAGPIAGSSASRSLQSTIAQPRASAPSSHPPPPDPNAR